ncbi:MAG: mevalonate kinase [Myxococcota bacterium]|nr:mevalonate kinase [Myxococcota bacterium]MDW8361765.1 mevalonate kinase [Myxococcales bacterium]
MAFGRGKVILVGEHAVVYGHPAIAAGLDVGVHAQARASADDRLCIRPWGRDVVADERSDEPLGRAFAALLRSGREGRPASPVCVEVMVQIPAAAGLGCSAALGVAIAGALDEWLGLRRPLDERERLALAWEREFHGNPSGIDTAVSLRGGVMWYRRGQAPEALRPACALLLVLVDSGQPSSTREMVARVAARREAQPALVGSTFDALGALAGRMREALARGDRDEIGRCFDAAHDGLCALGVSTERLDALCERARSAGALGAKPTGAGGGGCAIALVGDEGRAGRVLEACAAMGARSWLVEVGR